MQITVLVKPKSRETSTQLQADGSYVVRVTAVPVDGDANQAVIEELSKYFDVPKSLISIRSGAGSKRKRVDIMSATV